MSSDDTNRAAQDPTTQPPATGQAVTPEELADAVRARAERSETLRGDLGPEAPALPPAEVSRETTSPDLPAVVPETPALAAEAPTGLPEAPTSAPVLADAPTTHLPVYAQPPFSAPPSSGPAFGPALPPPPPPFGQAPWQPIGAVPPQPPKTGRLPKILAGTALALVLSLGAGTIGGLVGYGLHGSSGNPSSVATDPGRAAGVGNGTTLADVIDKIKDSVVGVKTGTGSGSGVIADTQGHILTNNHVVEGANGQLTVTFANGNTVKATVVGTDPANDLAVIKVEGVADLKPIVFGDSDAIKVGDSVLALGDPLGLEGSVTFGIVSAKNRTITEGGEQETPYQPASPTRKIAGLLQTDAAINPGNSGGALVDAKGNLMGINTAIATGSSSKGNVGIGFAIASNKAKAVYDQLVTGGKVSHPFLGVSFGDSPDTAGALIGSVTAGSPAEQAGLKAKDRITEVNGKPVKNGDALVALVQAGKAGDKLALTVVRDGKTITVTATLTEATS